MRPIASGNTAHGGDAAGDSPDVDGRSSIGKPTDNSNLTIDRTDLSDFSTVPAPPTSTT
jgi:hypothetical protein